MATMWVVMMRAARKEAQSMALVAQMGETMRTVATGGQLKGDHARAQMRQEKAVVKD